MGLDFKEHEYFHVIYAYRPRWPLQFAAIAAELASDLAFNNVSHISIEHVGSTSVPVLAAKPIIDILLVIAADQFHEIKRLQIMEALGWGRRPGQGGYSNDTREGGVKGRWSLKLNGFEPFQSLYVVPEGGNTGECQILDEFACPEGCSDILIAQELSYAETNVEERGGAEEGV